MGTAERAVVAIQQLKTKALEWHFWETSCTGTPNYVHTDMDILITLALLSETFKTRRNLLMKMSDLTDALLLC